MSQTLNLDQIKEIIPHRYENMLIDDVTIINPDSDDLSCEFTAKILEKDPYDRQLFSKQLKPGLFVLFPTVYIEMLALSAITTIGPEKGYTLVFSSIGEFVNHNPVPLETKLKGHAIKQSQKGPFIVCNGGVESDDKQAVIDAQIMAASVPSDAVSAKPSNSDYAIPENQLSYAGTWDNRLKSSSMICCDQLLQYNSESAQAIFSYTYPSDHPCVKGHFPNAPIMMGIMQLMCLEDSCFVLSEYLAQEGAKPQTISGDASLIRQDGTVIASIKKFEIAVLSEADGYIPHAEFVRLKKATFKNMAAPGDTLYIQLNNLQIAS